MRSPFSFISSRVRVVTLDMFSFQLGDFTLPEIAVRKLGVRNRQVRLPHHLVAVAHDIEVEGPRSPALATFPPPLRFDAPAVHQERSRRQRRFEQNHLVQIRRLRNRPERLCLFDLGGGDQARPGKPAEPRSCIRQVCCAIAQIAA